MRASKIDKLSLVCTEAEMATVSALITGAKTIPVINTRPDIQHMTHFCESNGFDIHCVHVNDPELSSHPKRKVYRSVLDYRRELAEFLSKPGVNVMTSNPP